MSNDNEQQVLEACCQYFRDLNDRPWYSPAQTTLLEIMPLIVSPFSILGSSAILWYLYCEKRKEQQNLQSMIARRFSHDGSVGNNLSSSNSNSNSNSNNNSYHRFMGSISIMDLIVSTAMVILGPWVVPESVPYTNLGRADNNRVCAATGFFSNLLFGSMWLAGFMSCYFVLLLRFEWKLDGDNKIWSRCFEPCMHAVAWFYPLVTGSFGLMGNILYPLHILPGWCWFSTNQPSTTTVEAILPNEGNDISTLCRSVLDPNGDDFEQNCEDKDSDEMLFAIIVWLDAFCIVCLFVTITVSMALIITKVRKTELDLSRLTFASTLQNELPSGGRSGSSHFIFRRGGPSDDDEQSAAATTTTRTTTSSALKLEKTRETSWQAIWLISSFFAVFSPQVILRFVNSNSSDGNYDEDDDNRAPAIVLLVAFFAKTLMPLQGFFNAVIFLRKKFWKLTQKGECFFFTRSFPGFVGAWITRHSEQYQQENHHTRGGRRGRTHNSMRRSGLSMDSSDPQRLELEVRQEAGESSGDDASAEKFQPEEESAMQQHRLSDSGEGHEQARDRIVKDPRQQQHREDEGENEVQAQEGIAENSQRQPVDETPE